MIERLAISDLVLADVSIPNGNAYYEVGIRHAAQRDDNSVEAVLKRSECLAAEAPSVAGSPVTIEDRLKRAY
jgi:hypothetical protein